MKRRFVCALAAAMLLPQAAMATKLNVVATTATFADLVKTVGGDHVEVSFVAPPKFNVHFIEPRPSDVFKVKKADVFAHAGLDLELWSGPLRDAAGNRTVLKGAEGELDLSRGIALMEVPHEQVSRAGGDIHLYGNPHYWTDPTNGRIIAGTIVDKLAELDPSNAADYKANLAAFRAKLDAKISEWQAKVAPYAGAKLIGYHNEWPYLMRFLGLTMDQFLEPKPGIPPGPKQLETLTGYAKSSDVRGIVQTVYFSDKAAKSLSADTGVPMITLSQNVGDVPESKDYISMVDYNVNTVATLMEGNK